MVNGYFPQSLKEALEFRAMYDAVPYSGGTDLMINADPDANYLFLAKCLNSSRSQRIPNISASVLPAPLRN